MTENATVRRHPIQLFILERLRVAPGGLRYTDMRPPNTENDLYNYHLQQLVSRLLVTKAPDGYRLSSAGLRYVIELNPVSEVGESHRFKLASLCLALRGECDRLEVLYQRRARQPHAGEEGFIGGGIKRGELATDAARRRLGEEAGLSGEFQLLGMLRKRHFDPAGDIYSDILFHVCVCTNAVGQLETSNEFGDQFWAPIAQAIEVESLGPIGSPRLGQILTRLSVTPSDQIPMFYFEETYRHDIY